ncbi:S66 peptidase family protein [Pseudomonas sp. LRF_L74]|uniref:S66 peptidase family protein n=1 Tax=Pseudomonas sp. LRF_L74 TaxID=3369422 RepID=UPI003F5D5E3C
MNTTFPGRLALIAPASSIADDVFEATLAQLDIQGVDYHLGRHTASRHRYLAGTVGQRLEDLHEAFGLPDISAVWCLRGGYGSAQLLPYIDWNLLASASPRPLIGFSDISVLLSAFHQRGLPAIHGSLASELGLNVLAEPREQKQRLASMASLRDLLNGRHGSLPARHLSGHAKPVEGELIGGNLTALASASGTLGQLYAPPGSILILEDVGEPYYRIERSLWQLLHSIDAASLGAVCLGTFSNCPRRNVAHSLEEIVSEYLEPLGVPLYVDLPCGHGADNHAWPYGKRGQLTDGQLSWA